MRDPTDPRRDGQGGQPRPRARGNAQRTGDGIRPPPRAEHDRGRLRPDRHAAGAALMTAAIGTLFGGGALLSIDRIRRAPRPQPRNHINHEVVERYRDAMEAGDAFPPVTVFFDGEEYWLADGWHRVCAAL